MSKSNTVAVVMNTNSRGLKSGDRVEVSKETADRLIRNGHARPADK